MLKRGVQPHDGCLLLVLKVLHLINIGSEIAGHVSHIDAVWYGLFEGAMLVRQLCLQHQAADVPASTD